MRYLTVTILCLTLLSACGQGQTAPALPPGFTVQEEKVLPDLAACRTLMEERMKGGGIVVKMQGALVMREILNSGYVLYQQCHMAKGKAQYVMARSDTAIKLKQSKEPLP